MRWFRFVVFICLVTVLQADMVDVIAIPGLDVKPDLLLIFLVFFSVYCSRTDAVITSFMIGFAADLIGPGMGPKIISFGLFGTAVAYLNRVIAVRKMLHQSIVIFAVGLLAGALAYLLTFLKGHPTVSNIYIVIFATSLYSSLIGPFLFLPIGWWMRAKKRKV